MSWQYENSGNDILNFKGKSNSIIGTWTRGKDKAASCKLDSYGDYSCQEGWDITKAVFTENSVKITNNKCMTDIRVDGFEMDNGWKENVIDCDTFEWQKGLEKIRIKAADYSKEETDITYKGKTCKFPGRAFLPVSVHEKACRDAYSESLAKGGDVEDYYDGFLIENIFKCLIENDFPLEPFYY